MKQHFMEWSECVWIHFREPFTIFGEFLVFHTKKNGTFHMKWRCVHWMPFTSDLFLFGAYFLFLAKINFQLMLWSDAAAEGLSVNGWTNGFDDIGCAVFILVILNVHIVQTLFNFWKRFNIEKPVKIGL